MNTEFDDKLGQNEIEMSRTEYTEKFGARLEDMSHCTCFLGIQLMIPDVVMDLRYATENNFMHQVLYTDPHMGYLLDVAAEKLRKAWLELKQVNSNYTFVVFDAARPRHVQQQMYNQVQNTEFEPYVASPMDISMHNFGVAVDLSIWDKEKQCALDMGCEFDTFNDLAEPCKEDQLLAEGKLSAEQVENRRLLRRIMTDAGFFHINFEWWHFNAMRYADAVRMLDPIR